MLRNWKQILTMLLGAALLAGSLPLAAHADRDKKRHRDRDRRVECKQERKHRHKEVRHHDRDRDRGHARYVDRGRRHYDDDDRDYRYSRYRVDCAPRVVHHHDRVVYAPYRPVHSGVTWSIYASNLPPDHYNFWDPYCGQLYASLHAYLCHVGHARHARVVQVVDDDG